MRFRKNKIVKLDDLPKRFSFDFKNGNDKITDNGNWSTMWKVRDENGKVYAGKFPRGYVSDHDIEKDFIKLNEEALNLFATSRYHENWIAQKICRIDPEWTPKPEGALAVRLEGTNSYFPAFVNEYDESFETTAWNLDGSDNILTELVERGFVFYFDAFRRKNYLADDKGGRKLIDFQLWGYQGIINPFPWLSHDTDEDFQKYFNDLQRSASCFI